MKNKGARRIITEPLFAAVQQLRQKTDEVIVALSGGKDSVACLELCHMFFPKVYAYHLYWFPYLRFREEYFRLLSQRYGGLEIYLLPHPDYLKALKYGQMRPGMELWMPSVSMKKVESAVRAHFGVEWIAYGVKRRDSFWRRGMHRQWGAINDELKKAYPLMEWKSRDVEGFLLTRGVPLPKDSFQLGFSLDATDPRGWEWLKRHYPDDYERVKEAFPFIEAVVRSGIRRVDKRIILQGGSGDERTPSR